MQTAEGKLYLYAAIDRTSKFAFVQLVKKTGRTPASAFLEALIAAVPYKIHTVLTDNGIQFTFPPRYADGPAATCMTHMFDMRCRDNAIEHHLTKIKHPWTNGQAERMNRTIKEATVKRYHYDRHEQLENHLADFINAYNYARRLKTLKGLTPYEFIIKAWTKEPQRFKRNPIHQMPGLNNALGKRGCEPCIPSTKSRPLPLPSDKTPDKQRHRIKNMFAKLKDWRRIATRDDRCAHTFFLAIRVAATVAFYLNQ